MHSRILTCLGRLAALLAILAGTAMPLAAQDRQERLPEELEGVGITEKLDNEVPKDLMFLDDKGRPVRLGDYFKDDKPVLVFIGYYGCPMLCGLVLNGTIDAMRDERMKNLVAGRDFRFVAISIDPNEDPDLASAKKDSLIESYGREGVVADEWHFLTGKEAEIKAVTDAFGFQFKWIDSTSEYSHAAVIHIVTPQGHISRYLYGVKFEPETLRLSLVEASEGKIGSTLDQILLFCFHFDPTTGKYSLAAINLMRLAGILTVVALAVGIGLALLNERRARAREAIALSESHAT